jgi:TolB protein
MRTLKRLAGMLAVASVTSADAGGAQGLGVFEQSVDIGAPRRAGSTVFNPTNQQYRVTGGGFNMWFTNDAFHFVWKKVSGDVSLAASITFDGAGGNAHRKACLLVRQSLDADAVYADAALHGDGLTSLQCRDTQGGATHEVQSNFTGPQRLRLEKKGHYVTLAVAREGEALHPSGASYQLVLQDPFYVGLAVCAHDDNALETAVFSQVELTPGTIRTASPPLISTLETITVASTDRRVVWWTTNLIEAPNWSRDGASLYFNSKGRMFRIPATGGEPQLIDTGFATRCNNDHGLSPDGAQLVISDQSQGDKRSRIYTLPVEGGTPRLITEAGPSYWHGWSPDGRTLAYCAERDGQFDIYTIQVGGGSETRLTSAPGLDDGPDYSPDGRFIYFNSDRTGSMRIWRMKPDGNDQQQVTSDSWNDWFPHPSPDGKWIVFLSYEPSVKGHPENKDVQLRMIPSQGGAPIVLARLFGGQGTINVPSWSPDSRRLAFVSYQVNPDRGSP